jgi:hypothetical protein
MKRHKKKTETKTAFIKRRIKSLEVIIEKTMEELINDVIIHIDDKYVLFNQYCIERKTDTIEIKRRRDYETVKFNKMKLAMMWIIFDYRHRYTERDRVRVLDSEWVSVEVDKQIHSKLKAKHRADIVLDSIYSTKLQTDQIKQKRIIAEIDKYSILANSISTPTRTKK